MPKADWRKAYTGGACDAQPAQSRRPVLGEDRWRSRCRRLAHLGLRDHQRCLAGIVDSDESMWCELIIGLVVRLFWLVDGRRAQRPLKGQHKAACKAILQDNPTRKGGAR
jgi:hypothetical protein